MLSDEFLDAMIVRVRHMKVPFGIESNGPGIIKPAGPNADPA
jgi:hypothetical protein